jgi:signal transduction histidine kinase
MGRTLRLPPTASDVAVATGAVLADLTVFSADLVRDLPAVAYASVAGLALVWRRRAPFAIFIFVWLHALTGLILFPGYGPIVGLLLALYTVAAHSSTIAARITLILASISVMTYAAHEAFFASQLGAEGAHGPAHRGVGAFLAFALFYGLLVGPAWAAGRWVKERRLRVQADEALATERVRIARELHDIVAHSVTVMMLEAAIAKRMINTDPGQAAKALADIDDQGQQAMSELRRMLVVLRADQPTNESQLDSGQQRGLAQVDALVSAVNRTGVAVDLESVGDRPRLDPSVDLAAYRVVQEALTNTSKHAGVGAHAVVRWTWTGHGDLTVQVSDDGEGRPDPATQTLSTGHGLLGLRERVAVVGGSIHAGPTPNGGFEVTATLPVVGELAGSAVRDSGGVAASGAGDAEASLRHGSRPGTAGML